MNMMASPVSGRGSVGVGEVYRETYAPHRRWRVRRTTERLNELECIDKPGTFRFLDDRAVHDPERYVRDREAEKPRYPALSGQDLKMAVERLIETDPALHAWGDGTDANWSVSAPALRWLAGVLRPGLNTLETGAGQSTIVFAAAGANHTCINLDPREAERIRGWCAAEGLRCEVRFIHESSDTFLPRPGSLADRLDVVFIDGAHRFPFPCLDWHYTEGRVPVGGLVVVDDWPMPSVKVLFDFLSGEDEWALAEVIDKTAIFRRERETVVVNDCQGQKMNARPWA